MTILNNLFKLFVKDKKVGLALGGGVARGLAHIGVLKSFKKHKIPIHFISGTSSGALIGVLYAAGMDPHKMESTAQRLGWMRFIRFVLARHGASSTEEIKKLIIKNIGNLKFSDLEIPFTAVSTDLKTGKEVVLKDGFVADAVAASCAFPGFFVPVKHGSILLVDGGIANNVPSGVVKKMGAGFVIACDVIPDFPIKEDLENMFQIFGRSLDLVMKKMGAEGRAMADILIEPKIPQDVWQLDVAKSKQLIKAGEEAAEQKIIEIKTRLAF